MIKVMSKIANFLDMDIRCRFKIRLGSLSCSLLGAFILLAEGALASGYYNLAAYYIPYDYVDKERDNISIAGLYAYGGWGAHSLELEASQYMDRSGEVFRHDLTGVYTFWPYDLARLRLGWINSDSEVNIAGNPLLIEGDVYPINITLTRASQGIIAGLFRDIYSEQGIHKYRFGFDFFLVSHQQQTVNDFDAQHTSDRINSLQATQYFAYHSAGIAEARATWELRHNYVYLSESLPSEPDHFQQFELHLHHDWQRWGVQLSRWLGEAAYIYQSGGFTGYNSSDILTDGIGGKFGWQASKNLRLSLAYQEYKYIDSSRLSVNQQAGPESTHKFRKLVAMINLSFPN